MINDQTTCLQRGAECSAAGRDKGIVEIAKEKIAVVPVEQAHKAALAQLCQQALGELRSNPFIPTAMGRPEYTVRIHQRDDHIEVIDIRDRGFGYISAIFLAGEPDLETFKQLGDAFERCWYARKALYEPNAGFVYVHNVKVARDARRCGVAKGLVREVINRYHYGYDNACGVNPVFLCANPLFASDSPSHEELFKIYNSMGFCRVSGTCTIMHYDPKSVVSVTPKPKKDDSYLRGAESGN